jgi:hypothetical protein
MANGGRWGRQRGGRWWRHSQSSRRRCRFPFRGVGEMGTWRGSLLTLAPVATTVTVASMVRSCLSEARRQMEKEKSEGKMDSENG